MERESEEKMLRRVIGGKRLIESHHLSRPVAAKHEKSLTYTTTGQIHSEGSFHVTIPSTDSTVKTDRQLPLDEATYGYSTGYGGNMGQVLNNFTSTTSQQSMQQTPDLVLMPNSSQTGASLELPTPLDTYSVWTGSPIHGTTGISPDMERFNLGDPNQMFSYRKVGSSSPSKKQTGQEEIPAGLFQTEKNGAERLGNIDEDLHSLHQFPEANPFQYEEQDSYLPDPSSASLENNYFASTVPSGWQSRDGYVTGFGAAQYPSGVDLSDNIFLSGYFSDIWNQSSGSVGDSHAPLLSREPLSPHGIGPIRTPEKRQRKPSAVCGLSTESSCKPLSPSGIVDTTFERREEKSTAICLQTLDEEIVKKERASAAQREAANSRRKRERRFECRICGDTLTSSQNLKNHMNSHKQVKPYKCEYCQDKSYRHIRSLNRHVKKKHS